MSNETEYDLVVKRRQPTQKECDAAMVEGFEQQPTASEFTKALEQSSVIFSKKLSSIREKQKEAIVYNHKVENKYWHDIYYQIFELRMEIERMLDKLKLNEFCILMAFMPEEKREAAIAKKEGERE